MVTPANPKHRLSPSGPKLPSEGVPDNFIYVNQVRFPNITFEEVNNESGATKESQAYIWPFPVIVPIPPFTPDGQYPVTAYEVVVNPSRPIGDDPPSTPEWVGSGGVSHVRVVRYNATPADFAGLLDPGDPLTVTDPAPDENGVIVALGMQSRTMTPDEVIEMQNLVMDLIFIRQVAPTLHSSVPALL
jgi:hypothetical protein